VEAPDFSQGSGAFRRREKKATANLGFSHGPRSECPTRRRCAWVPVLLSLSSRALARARATFWLHRRCAKWGRRGCRI